ncbi:hypothetical protein [Kitasatospora sp. NPDC004289]
MPLVYVHGIANRQGRAYRRKRELRDALFRRHALAVTAKGVPDRVLNPYWGSLAGALARGGASFPGRRGLEAFGPQDGPEDEGLRAALEAEFGPDAAQRYVLETARRSPVDAVDLLFLEISEVESDADPGELADLAGRLLEWARSGAAAGLLDEVSDDRQLLERLRQLLGDEPGRESFSLLDDAWAALGRVVTRLRAAVEQQDEQGTTVRLVRAASRRAVPRSIGDIAAYLAHRGTPERPGPIVGAVVEALEDAVRDNPSGLPVVVVAHSLGGVIAYDVLSAFRPDLRVDVLVTVGSQVGLFAELGALAAPVGAVPENIGQWTNVVDLNDPLAFLAAPVFDRVSDLRYSSGALWAHGAYLGKAHFHARLAARLAEATG